MKLFRNNLTWAVSLVLIFLVCFFIWSGARQTRLIMRGDDMGYCRGANLGCIEAYQNGILTAVEVMVPCDHFLEAVELLKENPGLDIGIHLTLNSEWENLKWGPLTDAPSLVDEQGHFFPMTWPDAAYPEGQALGSADWKLDEIERELRAQIETALHFLPSCSHATAHMGFHAISPRVTRLVMNLMREYNVDANLRLWPMRQLYLFGDATTADEMVDHAVDMLNNLGPGTWECYEHPGKIVEGYEPAWQVGAEEDAIYRAAVTEALTDPRLKEALRRNRIKLIGYDQLRSWY